MNETARPAWPAALASWLPTHPWPRASYRNLVKLKLPLVTPWAPEVLVLGTAPAVKLNVPLSFCPVRSYWLTVTVPLLAAWP